MHVHVLRRAVACQELTAHIHNGLAVPLNANTRIARNGCHRRGLQVLLGSQGQELLHILGRQSHGHALLALGDCQLGAVKALVLLRNRVQVDAQAVGQLANCHRHAARTEIVAALDHLAGILAAEEALNLALHGRIALLHFGAAALQRVHVVSLRGSRRAANAVAASAAAQQHHHIARRRRLTTHVVSRGSAHYRANLHALCGVAGMVQLVHLTRCQANLVTVRGIASCGRSNQLALRQLAGNGLGNRNQRVSRAGHAHGLIDVAATGKRVTNSAANAGGRAAKGLDLRRMVMRLVLEQVEPVLLLSVHIALDLDGTGVNLLRLVKVLQNALGLQVTSADSSHIHEADRLVVTPQLVAHLKILLERSAHGRIVNGHVLKHRAEGGVTAMIGPVSINHLDFGDGGVALLACEVLLAELDVSQVHGKAALCDERRKPFLVKLQEAVDGLHALGHGVFHLEGLALLKRGLARLDGVDDVMLDGRDILLRERPLKQIHLRAAHLRALALADQLNALACRVGTLVKLARQILHGKHVRAVRIRQLESGVIRLRLAENRRHALLEQLIGNALHIIAIEQAQALKILDLKDHAQLAGKLLSLDVKAGLLLDVHTGNHTSLPSFSC